MGNHRGPALRATRLSHIGLRSPQADDLARFYVDVVGLRVHGRLDGGVVRLGWGAGHHAMEIRPGQAGLDHLAFEVRDAGGIESCAAALAAAGAAVATEPACGEHPAVVTARDPGGNCLEFHGPVDRSGELVADAGRRPIRVQHATMNARDMAAMVGFYTGLGFTVSDRIEDDSFVWLRSDPAHHSLALVAARGEGALDHYAYDVGGWPDFKTWCDHLGASRVPVSWGPARHGPGNNLFVMFADPDGNRIELSAELERFWDDLAEYQPRVWRNDPWTVNLWGGTGPDWRLSQPTRRNMW